MTFFCNPVTLSCSNKLYTENCVYTEIQTANQIATFKCLKLTGQKSGQKISEVPGLLGEACEDGYACPQMLPGVNPEM